MGDQTQTIKVYTDGGARGNPGPSASGFYIETGEGLELAAVGRKIGITTNNVAEYQAILEALDWIIQNRQTLPGLSRVNFYMDSQLAVSQLNGLYKIKNETLRKLHTQAKTKEIEIGIPVIYLHIPREQNRKADKLVNMALDNKI